MKRTVSIGVLCCCLSSVAFGQAVEIESFDHNGRLTWVAPTSGVCTVQWAPTLSPAPDWRSDWSSLTAVETTNVETTVQVPMFYRILSWTNGLFVSVRPGRILRYSVTNGVGQAYTNETHWIGFASGPRMTNAGVYAIALEKTLYEGIEPEGVPDADDSAQVVRITDTAYYSVTPLDQQYLQFQTGPVGLSWTNDPDPGDGPMLTTIESTNDTVVVPAGTFSNCVRLCSRSEQEPGGELWRYYVWIKPGFGVVKGIDYFISAPPHVEVLESWHDE